MAFGRVILGSMIKIELFAVVMDFNFLNLSVSFHNVGDSKWNCNLTSINLYMLRKKSCIKRFPYLHRQKYPKGTERWQGSADFNHILGRYRTCCKDYENV